MLRGEKSWQQRILSNVKKDHPHYTAKRTKEFDSDRLDSKDTRPPLQLHESQNTQSSEAALAQHSNWDVEILSANVYRACFHISGWAQLPEHCSGNMVSKASKDLMVLGETHAVLSPKMLVSAVTWCVLAYMIPTWFKCYSIDIKVIKFT